MKQPNRKIDLESKKNVKIYLFKKSETEGQGSGRGTKVTKKRTIEEIQSQAKS